MGCLYTVRETTGRDRRRPNIRTSLYTYVICIRVLQQTHVCCHERTNRCCLHWHGRLHVSVNDVQLSSLTQVLSMFLSTHHMLVSHVSGLLAVAQTYHTH